MVQHSGTTGCRKHPEPSGESRSRRRLGGEVGFSVAGVDLGSRSSSNNNRPSRGRAPDVGGALGEAPSRRPIGAGDCKSGAVDLGGVRFGNISVDDPNFALLIDNVETGIRHEFIGPYSWIGEVVCLEHCKFDFVRLLYARRIGFENVQLCTTLVDSPGARTLYSPSFAAISGEYLTSMPVNEGLPPFSWTMENLLTGVSDANVRGSSSSFTVSLPVLVMMASTLKLSAPATLLGPRDINERQIGSFQT